MKTNSGLVLYAKAQLGKPYWYGTFGQTASAELYKSNKARLPSYYTANDFTSQYGKRVHDCVGLIKGYIWSDSASSAPKYAAAQDKSAAGMYAASILKGEGALSFPKKAGMLLYKGPTPAKITHVGIYGGDGYVYEAKGHAYGVVKTVYNASDWPYWSQCPYITDDSPRPSARPTDAQVREAIEKLAGRGIINTPEYWENNYSKLEYLDILIINMANAL